MSQRITLQPHLSLDELEARYRQAKEPIEGRQYHIIWLLAQGFPTEDVAAITGYSRDWVYKLARRYNQLGAEGLGDRRRDNPGAEPFLSEAQQIQLSLALQGNAPDGRSWNGRKVADWMSKLLERPVSPQRGWEYLRSLSMRYTPRTQQKATPTRSKSLKKSRKKLTARREPVQQKYPEAEPGNQTHL
jgi:transposase